MSLLERQTALARLSTEPGLRSLLEDRPAQICQQLDLSPDDAQWLTQLDPGQVDRFARSLRQKRLNGVRAHAPASMCVLGHRASHVFAAYADDQTWPGRGVRDALLFLRFLRARSECNTPLLMDVVRCEEAMLRILLRLAFEVAEPAPMLGRVAVPRRTGRMAVRKVGCDLETLYPRLAHGESVTPEPDPCYVLIGRGRGSELTRVMRINDATACLLDLCDGSRPVELVIEEVAARIPLSGETAARFATEAHALLRQLLASGLLAA